MMRSPTKQTRRNNDFKVQVAVRVRPQSSGENTVVSVSGAQITAAGRQPAKTFAFDHCFDEATTQRTIYSQFGSDIVQHALEGYNACIFAYGQTGAGKSHTMLGNASEPGLIPQICDRVFAHVADVHTNTAVTVRVSFLEIYNEQVRDLLGSSQDRPSLRVRGTGGDDCYVEGLSEFKVGSVGEVLDLLRRGMRSRATAATKMNDTSSRSHAVVSLTIKQQSVASAGDKSTEEKLSVLRLVDLAGSERAGASNATGDRLREGSNINKSLVTLGRVISALAGLDPATNAVVVPYRESVLTRLLENSLGGNSRTAMIACVSPDPANADQTLSTLRYADQAKRITTRAHINRDTISGAKHAERLAAIQQELTDLRQQLAVQQGSAQHETELLARLVQFHEDDAARERVRSSLFEQQVEAERQRSLELADYLRELSGRGLSSIDVPEDIDFDTLLAEQDRLAADIGRGRAQVAESARKWHARLAEAAR